MSPREASAIPASVSDRAVPGISPPCAFASGSALDLPVFRARQDAQGKPSVKPHQAVGRRGPEGNSPGAERWPGLPPPEPAAEPTAVVHPGDHHHAQAERARHVGRLEGPLRLGRGGARRPAHLGERDVVAGRGARPGRDASPRRHQPGEQAGEPLDQPAGLRERRSARPPRRAPRAGEAGRRRGAAAPGAASSARSGASGTSTSPWIAPELRLRAACEPRPNPAVSPCGMPATLVVSAVIPLGVTGPTTATALSSAEGWPTSARFAPRENPADPDGTAGCRGYRGGRRGRAAWRRRTRGRRPVGRRRPGGGRAAGDRASSARSGEVPGPTTGRRRCRGAGRTTRSPARTTSRSSCRAARP